MNPFSLGDLLLICLRRGVSIQIRNELDRPELVVQVSWKHRQDVKYGMQRIISERMAMMEDQIFQDLIVETVADCMIELRRHVLAKLGVDIFRGTGFPRESVLPSPPSPLLSFGPPLIPPFIPPQSPNPPESDHGET